MCYRPVHIVNTLRGWTDAQFAYMDVPCGQCEDCKDVRRNDWFVRSYALWNSGKWNNAFFYTLTYDNEHLPMAYDRPCFSRDVFQRFVKRLRDHLKRKLGVFEFHLLACSEFGDVYKRPHHHILLFMPHPVYKKGLYNLIEDVWQQGFIHVSAGTDYGTIQGVNGLKYACKYVVKCPDYDYRGVKFRTLLEVARQYDASVCNDAFGDSEEYPRTSKEFKDFMRQPHSSPESLKAFHATLPYQFYKAWSKKYREVIPFTTSTQGYGALSVDSLSQYQIDNSVILSPNHDGSFVSLPLPKYIKRKLYYTTMYNPTTGKQDLFRLNDLGLEVKMKKVQERLRSISMQAQTFQNEVAHLNFDEVYTNCMKGWTPADCKDFIRYVPLDFNYYAKYSTLYRNLGIDLSQIDELDQMSTFMDLYSQSLLPSDDLSQTCSSRVYSDIVRQNRLLNLDYEVFFDIMFNYNNKIRREAATSRAHDSEIRRKIKQFQKLKKLQTK